MKVRNSLLILVALSVTLSAAAASRLAALAAAEPRSVVEQVAFQEALDVSLGRSGLFMPSSAYTGLVELSRERAGREHPARDLDFLQNLTEVRVTDGSGDEFERVFGLNYLYYNLNRSARAAWDDGELNIYYFDPDEREWVECQVQVLIETKNRPSGRLACVISDFGLYGLGAER